MLDSTDKRILRALANIALGENPSENYIAKKTSKLSTPTVRRHLTNLVKNGYVKYLGRGKQRSRQYRLELKGLFYLLSYEKLTDIEIMNTTKATINALPVKRKRRSLLRMFATQIAKETVDIVNEVKHKINFDFFDENYVSEVFFNSLFEHLLKIAIDIKNSNKMKDQDAHVDMKALKSNALLNEGLTLFLEGNLEYYRKEKQNAENRYQFCRKMWMRWNKG